MHSLNSTTPIISKLFEGKEVRVAWNQEHPWFIAKDIGEILDIKRMRDIYKDFPDPEKRTIQVRTPGGTQEMTALNEVACYRVVFQSPHPDAEAFGVWLVMTALPSLRTYFQHRDKTASEPLRDALGDAPSSAWEVVLNALKRELGEPVYYSWILYLAFSRIEGDTVFLKAKCGGTSPFIRDMIAQRYGNDIRRIWQAQNPAIREVILEADFGYDVSTYLSRIPEVMAFRARYTPPRM